MQLNALISFEVKRKLKTTLIFCLVWIGFFILFLSFFDSLKASGEELAKLYETFPKELLQALGKDLEQVTNIYGYFSYSIMLYLVISGSILSVVMLCNSITGEIANGNIVFLISKPISRTKIFVAKYLSLIINLLIGNFILGCAAYIIVRLLTQEDSFNIFYIKHIFFLMLLLELFFATFGLFIATLTNHSRGVAVGVLLVLVSYIFKLIASLSEDASILKYLSANYYVDIEVVKEGTLLNPNIVVIIVSTIILFALALRNFKSKDIQ